MNYPFFRGPPWYLVTFLQVLCLPCCAVVGQTCFEKRTYHRLWNCHSRQIACLPEVEKNAVDWFLTEDRAQHGVLVAVSQLVE